MAEEIRFKFPCSECETPIAIDDPAFLFRFPGDVDAILDLISWKLTIFECPVCREPNPAPLPCAFIDDTSRQMIVANATTELAAQLAAGAGFDVETELIVCRGMSELRRVVLERTQRYSNDSVEQLLQGEDRVSEALRIHDTPLPTVMLCLMLDGEVQVQIRSKPPTPAGVFRETFEAIAKLALLSIVRELYTFAFHNGGIETYLDLLQDLFPARCVHPSLLVQLEEACEQAPQVALEDPTSIDKRFRAEYIHACVRYIAGRANPRIAEWTDLMGHLFFLSERPDIRLPASFLLRPEVLKKLVPIPSFWNRIVMPLFETATDSEDLAQSITPVLERIAAGFGWSERVGYELHRGPFRLSIGDQGLDVAGLVASLHQQSTRRETDESGSLFALAIEQFCMATFESGQGELAIGVLEEALDTATGESLSGLAHMSQSAVKVMNSQLRPLDAIRLWNRHSGTLTVSLSELDPYIPMMLFNEIGNSFRYLGDTDGALRAYAECGRRIPGLKHEGAHLRVLKRNVAIALREAGRFDEALETLDEVRDAYQSEVAPERAKFLHTEALTYFEANQRERAFEVMDQACAIEVGNDPHLIAQLRMGRALSCAPLSADDAANDLRVALRAAGNASPLRESVACAILNLDRRVAMPRELTKAAVSLLEESLPKSTTQGIRSIRLSSAVALVDWMLRKGDRLNAHALACEELVEVPGGKRHPWEAHLALARTFSEEQQRERFETLMTALARAEGEAPDQSSVEMLASWMSNKEDLQSEIRRAAEEAVDAAGTSIADLIAIAEFQTARELRGAPRVDVELDSQARERRPLADLLPSSSTVLIFLELHRTVRGIVIDATSPEGRLLPPKIDRARLANGVGSFLQQIARAIPGRAKHLDDLVALPLSEIEPLISPLARENDHICVVPSSILLGLPFHACRDEGGRLLIENCGMSVAPNLATLRSCLEAPQRDLARRAVASITKRGDTEAFNERARRFADHATQLMGDVVRLEGESADKRAMVDLVERADLLVVLAHGVDSGRERGIGIAVAAGGELPPALLPVEHAPALRDFVMDASDLLEVDQTPALFVSLACSIGRSVAGPGGIRSGFEKSLFARGTQSMVAPLWNVDQESAILFLERFLKSILSGASPAVAHRRACNDSRERYPDVFRWAPFALNGSWHGDHSQ